MKVKRDLSISENYDFFVGKMTFSSSWIMWWKCQSTYQMKNPVISYLATYSVMSSLKKKKKQIQKYTGKWETFSYRCIMETYTWTNTPCSQNSCTIAGRESGELEDVGVAARHSLINVLTYDFKMTQVYGLWQAI